MRDADSPTRTGDPLVDPVAARYAIRSGAHDGHTAGLARGRVQANVVILPADYAATFAAFCHANPKPCPLLAQGAPGDPRLPAVADDLDIRTDVPRYRVWRDGALVDEVTSIETIWRDDLVGFAIGCSFSFEQALIEHDVPLRYVTRGDNVAMYRTNIETLPAGPFSGPMVVSMRPFAPADAIRAIQVTSRFPTVHGAPVHIGHPHLIGIDDVEQPDFGDPPRMEADDVPVFWACGVTPQVAIERAKPPLAITHSPGHMLILDGLNVHLAVI